MYFFSIIGKKPAVEDKNVVGDIDSSSSAKAEDPVLVISMAYKWSWNPVCARVTILSGTPKCSGQPCMGEGIFLFVTVTRSCLSK